MNNLHDTSLTEANASVCGYTQLELEQVFESLIKNLAQKEGTSQDQQLEKIKLWYNGCQFSERDESVYNPFSTLVLIRGQAYKPYWIDAGTPTFIVVFIEQQNFSPQQIEYREVRTLAL